MSTAVEIACRDGVRLAGDHFPAVGDAQGSIVVACALGVRRAFYQRFAVLAAASGYEVLLFSYRGSEGDDPAVASYRLADWDARTSMRRWPGAERARRSYRAISSATASARSCSVWLVRPAD